MATTARSYWWHRYTSEESFQRILNGEDPWIAIGDFLDEWRREDVKDRCELVTDPLAPSKSFDHQRWASFFSAMVEHLCIGDGLPIPTWVENERFVLVDPWFLYPGWRLTAWQLATTPLAFKKRNILAEIGYLTVRNLMGRSVETEKRVHRFKGDGDVESLLSKDRVLESVILREKKHESSRI